MIQNFSTVVRDEAMNLVRSRGSLACEHLVAVNLTQSYSILLNLTQSYSILLKTRLIKWPIPSMLYCMEAGF